jgi:hypothetical protein
LVEPLSPKMKAELKYADESYLRKNQTGIFVLYIQMEYCAGGSVEDLLRLTPHKHED